MRNMLVVEDDYLVQKVFPRIFDKNFKVDLCDSAEEFYSTYSNKNYDIIIMDISLKGGKSGIELVHEIKTNPLFTKTPILCLTADVNAKERKNIINLGIDMFLTKPVSIDILKNSVESLLKKYNL
ncbi:response regulator [Melioribacteraceae bacterium 4301-Me]|uniref:response regulator n=1 Tax=Pyranulibacter aquaticus TaxID=3163344 RepID=UPI003595F006